MTSIASSNRAAQKRVTTGSASPLSSCSGSSAFEKVKERVDRICAKAFKLGIPVLMDAEESWIQNPIDALAYEMMIKYNQESKVVSTT